MQSNEFVLHNIQNKHNPFSQTRCTGTCLSVSYKKVNKCCSNTSLSCLKKYILIIRWNKLKGEFPASSADTPSPIWPFRLQAELIDSRHTPGLLSGKNRFNSFMFAPEKYRNSSTSKWASLTDNPNIRNEDSSFWMQLFFFFLGQVKVQSFSGKSTK